MSIVKICKCCKVHKDLSEFNKLNRCYSLNCKECIEFKRIERNEKKRKSQKEYYLKNKGYYKDYNEKYYNENLEYYSNYSKEYNRLNRYVINTTRRNYRSERISNDPLFKLSENIRGLIRKSLKNGSYRKSSITENIIGCSFSFLIEYLNDNEYNFCYEDNLETHLYDIDHIIPLSSATSESEFIELNHYTNFQLLPSEYNRYIKSDNKFDKKHFEDWLLNNPTM